MKTSYKGLIPKIHYVYAGYRGLDKGLAISWLGRMKYIVKPINERRI
jgi:hypothetical protein